MLVHPATDLSEGVRSGFGAVFGRPPGVVARAPGRVNLVGEHTDYHGGLCLPVALPHSTWVASAPRDDTVVRLHSTTLGETWAGEVGERGNGWAAYVTATLDALGHRRGLDLLVDSTVPVGAGLSSSAALICATATAVSSLSPQDLLEPCIRAEVEGVGAPTGGLDQSISLLARAGHALLLDFGDGSRQHVPWRPDRAGLELVVVDTRTRHDHADGRFGERRREGVAAMGAEPDALDALGTRRRRHVLGENQRVRDTVRALSRDDWEEVGRLMSASHVSLRDDYEVSCPELDLTVASASSAGALGSRMTGGGFGGCALVLVPAADRDHLLAEVQDAFAHAGWASPRWLPVAAGGPATRLPLS